MTQKTHQRLKSSIYRPSKGRNERSKVCFHYPSTRERKNGIEHKFYRPYISEWPTASLQGSRPGPRHGPSARVSLCCKFLLTNLQLCSMLLIASLQWQIAIREVFLVPSQQIKKREKMVMVPFIECKFVHEAQQFACIVWSIYEPNYIKYSLV